MGSETVAEGKFINTYFPRPANGTLQWGCVSVTDGNFFLSHYVCVRPAFFRLVDAEFAEPAISNILEAKR